MFEISRRDLVLGSTAAGLVFGLKAPVSFIGAAHAQRAADSLKYKVGDIEVFSLHEGAIEREVTESMVKNVGLDDVKKALTAGGIGPDKISNPFTVTAIKTGGKIVLFDTGFGANVRQPSASSPTTRRRPVSTWQRSPPSSSRTSIPITSRACG
jgi:hypothetical protein